MDVAVIDPRSLALKYRPSKFSEVLGQDQCVGFLRNLIRKGKLTRHILLYGSIGSGKTTLARIYATALQCMALEADGSPCMACAGCLSVKSDRIKFVEIDAPSFDNDDEFRAKLEPLLRPPPAKGERRVIFIDEAHTLRRLRYSFDFLLKELEEAPPELSFILATTQEESISNALKSRMAELKVSPLSLELSRALLKGVLEREGILDAEDEALTLIWSLGDGQPRNMLQALDQVRVIGKITRDAVRDNFDIKDIDASLNYFLALGQGDFALQSKYFFAWGAPVRTKVSRIQALLVSIYYNDLIGQEMVVDPVVASIRTAEREPLIDAFKARFPDQAMLLSAWREMLNLLPINPHELTDESLLARIILFQERVCSGDLGAMSPTIGWEVPREPVPIARPAARKRVEEKNPKYLSLAEVRKIFNSASAFTQATGRCFNVKITIRHDAFGCSDQPSAGENAGKFARALSGRLKSWFGHGDRMLIQESNARIGRCGRIVTSLPSLNEEAAVQLSRWIRQWRKEARSEALSKDAIEVELGVGESPIVNHWDCVRWICAGLDPHEGLRDHLRLAQREAGEIGEGTRYASSDSCGTTLKEITGKSGLPFLSAFNAENWSEIYGGWEPDVFRIRSRLAAQSGNIETLRDELEALRIKRNLGSYDPNDDV